MDATPYFYDALDYYRKAKILQDRNHYGGKLQKCGDPLMDNVSIFDTVLRKHAGFSNVLEDLWRRGVPQDFPNAGKRPKHDEITWIYLFGIHRYTGSGASFFPKSAGVKRHGYNNTILFDLAFYKSIDVMRYFIQYYGKPMFTSLGNQIIPAPKPKFPFTSGAKYYLCIHWPRAAEDFYYWLKSSMRKPTIREATEWLNRWNVKEGFKRFTFCSTALVMDVAEYLPHLINPSSQCNYGSNCLLSFDAMFDSIPRKHSKKWYDEAMIQLCKALQPLAPKGVGARPMDVEDSPGCDIVRYWLEFIPKVGYDHLTEKQRHNKSRIKKLNFQKFIQARK